MSIQDDQWLEDSWADLLPSRDVEQEVLAVLDGLRDQTVPPAS